MTESSSKKVHEPIIIGVINVTPDSFSDGGQFINENKAVEHSYQLVQEGAKIIDIGGESTRPNAQVVDIQEEIDRVCPVIERVKDFAPNISIDSRNAQTMREAIKAGANFINDISALTHDSESIAVASEVGCPVFLMHMQGNPQIMQEKPSYNNVVEDIFEHFKTRIQACETACIERKSIIIDPGIGFGKTLEHNLLILRNISRFHDLGCELLIGTSRKSFIAAASQNEPVDARLPGSLSSALWGLSQGVRYFRVHDVKETRQAFAIQKAIQNAS